MKGIDRETQIEILSRAMDSIIGVRQKLAAGDPVPAQLLNEGMVRCHLAEALCFDLKHKQMEPV